MPKLKKRKLKKFYIGVDVGGTKISAAIVDSSSRVLLRSKQSSPSSNKPSVVGRQIEELIEDILADAKLAKKSLRGIGVGIPGIVEPKTNKILVTPNIALAGYPLAQRLRKLFHTKVALGNDANLGTLAEKWSGVGKNVENIVGIFVGTGVGGGIIIDGKVYTGAQGAGGEIGHMIIDLNSMATSAGVPGTLEALTGRRAIERSIREALAHKKKTKIKELANGNLKVIKSKTIAKALRIRDPLVTEVMNHVCVILGKACISLRHTLNPDMIILGGGVMEACGEFILPRVKKVFDHDRFLSGIDKCKIVQSKLGDDAVLLGAVALVKDK